MSVDTSSYALQKPSSSGLQNASALLSQSSKKNSSQNNNNEAVVYPETPTQNSMSYGSGTDMTLLGAGKDYGSTN